MKIKIRFCRISIVIILAFLSLLENINAQAPNWLWAKRVGGNNYDDSRSAKVDASGNVYVAGWFWSPTISFGATTLTNSGVSDIYIVKYDSIGNVLWAKKAGGSSDEEAHSITVDTSGNVYVVGYFQSSSITFGAITLAKVGLVYNMFIVKYDSNGNALWANNAGGGGPVNIDNATSVTTDVTGNIYVAGYFESSNIIFASTTLNNSGGSDLFIVKYDTNGNLLWAKRAGGIGAEQANSITADVSGNILMAGWFHSPTITFGSITLTNTNSSSNRDVDMFIVKYDATGNVLWARMAGKDGGGFGNSARANSVAADASGNVYVTGTYGIFGITFDGSTTLTSSGGTDMFIAKYDASGLVWATKAGGTSGDGSTSVAVDATGNIYLTGYFSSSSITFGSTTFTNSDPTVNSADLFIVKYNANGSVAWAKKAGGTFDDLPFAITTDAIGTIYVVGYFMSPSLTFGCTTLTNVDATGNYADVFIVKVNSILSAVSASISANGSTTICNGNSVTLTANNAPAYLWSNGSTTQSITVSTSGNYSVTVTDANVCSATSSATTVTVNPLPTAAITTSGATTFCQGNSVTLTGGSANSYLWSNGETTPGIIVTATGNYNVTVTDANNCSATSTITSVNVTYCTVIINFKAYIEGFYISGADSMQAVIDPVNYPSICDTVTLQLADSASHQIVASDKRVISTQGQGSFNFTGLQPGHRYYLVFRHRNSLQTWSKHSFLFDNPVWNFDFTRL